MRILDEVCLRITVDDSFPPRSLLDTTSLYDSNEWLYKLDKPIPWKDAIQFIPPVNKGLVIKVYDGDTITIASKLPYSESCIYRFSVRLNGIDCPEIKGKTESEKQCAQIAKKELSNLILNKIISLKNVQNEKYGRILADVYLDDLHLNNFMIEKRLAVTYNGGTKVCPNNWMDYYTKGEL
jgi:endonuclease YncB( thermonuclease family)